MLSFYTFSFTIFKQIYLNLKQILYLILLFYGRNQKGAGVRSETDDKKSIAYPFYNHDNR